MSFVSQSENESEFVSLLTQYQGDIFAYTMSLVAGNAEALDLRQEVNMVLWNKREHYTMGSNFKAWAFAISRYVVLNHQRTQRRERKRIIFNDNLMELVANEAPVALTESNERLHHLTACMERLKPKDRELVDYHYQPGSRLKVYAERSGRSENSLSGSLIRIRAALRRCVESKFGTV